MYRYCSYCTVHRFTCVYIHDMYMYNSPFEEMCLHVSTTTYLVYTSMTAWSFYTAVLYTRHTVVFIYLHLTFYLRPVFLKIKKNIIKYIWVILYCDCNVMRPHSWKIYCPSICLDLSTFDGDKKIRIRIHTCTCTIRRMYIIYLKKYKK